MNDPDDYCAPPTAAYVTARLHGGPRHGETLTMPWARYDIHLPRWGRFADDAPGDDHYRLSGPWRGQSTADYAFVPAADELPQPSGERPGGMAVRRADPCEGVAAPSQPRMRRPLGVGFLVGLVVAGVIVAVRR